MIGHHLTLPILIACRDPGDCCTQCYCWLLVRNESVWSKDETHSLLLVRPCACWLGVMETLLTDLYFNRRFIALTRQRRQRQYHASVERRRTWDEFYNNQTLWNIVNCCKCRTKPQKKVLWYWIELDKNRTFIDCCWAWLGWDGASDSA